jgi:hypothetical protein
LPPLPASPAHTGGRWAGGRHSPLRWEAACGARGSPAAAAGSYNSSDGSVTARARADATAGAAPWDTRSLLPFAFLLDAGVGGAAPPPLRALPAHLAASRASAGGAWVSAEAAAAAGYASGALPVLAGGGGVLLTYAVPMASAPVGSGANFYAALRGPLAGGEGGRKRAAFRRPAAGAHAGGRRGGR